MTKRNTKKMNHFMHMNLITGCPQCSEGEMVYPECPHGTAPSESCYDAEDAYYDKQFAQEMAEHGTSQVHRRYRQYTCSRPCCGRPSVVNVYTDMKGVRKVVKPVRECKHCGVAWSVIEGKVICDFHTDACARYGEHSSSEQEAAWDALLPPVLSPF